MQHKQEAQNPLILRSQRLMEAFAKSDDERDFYLDRKEGFLIYVDLDKPEPDLKELQKELTTNSDRYCMIPKLTFYETKKIMEGFVNEKVYDIDTKEKLLDIIQSKEARENFLEFIYDHHTELEKWQQFYQERSRIRIIEWLRVNHFHFVFEEDLDMPKQLIEKLKKELFQSKAGKDVITARKSLALKAKTYYSNEALNPRPKRGRPPKQAAKLEVEHQVSTDIYTTVPAEARQFLFIPDYTSFSSVTFSSKFESEEELLASRRAHSHGMISPDTALESLNQKLAALRSMSSRWMEGEATKKTGEKETPASLDEEENEVEIGWDEEDLDEESGLNEPLDEEEEFQEVGRKLNGKEPKMPVSKKMNLKASKPSIKKKIPAKKAPIKKIFPKKMATPKASPKKPLSKVKSKPAPAKKPQFRSIIKPKKLSKIKSSTKKESPKTKQPISKKKKR
jgi:hypothetical protein